MPSIPTFSFSPTVKYLPKITGLEAEYSITMVTSTMDPVDMTFEPLSSMFEILYNGNPIYGYTFGPGDQGTPIKFSVRTKSTMLTNSTAISCIIRHKIDTTIVNDYVVYNSRESVATLGDTIQAPTGVIGPAVGVNSSGVEYLIMANDRPLLDEYLDDIGVYDFSKIITTNITDFSSLFFGHNFIGMMSTVQDISKWDTRNVTTMANMARDVYGFIPNLSKWNVGNVRDMSSMFRGADEFQSDLSLWNTSKVTDMNNMFRGTGDFNSDIDSWDTSNVTNMSYMFATTGGFEADLNSWDTSKVVDMSFMFCDAIEFNGHISKWNISKVTNMTSMFEGATSFNQEICGWDVSKVTSMEKMFKGASNFNKYVGGWNVTSVDPLTGMNSTFESASNFNQNLSFWNVIPFTPVPSGFNAGANAVWTSNPGFQPKWGDIPNDHLIESSISPPPGTLGHEGQFYVDISETPKLIYGPKVGLIWGDSTEFTGTVIEGFGEPLNSTGYVGDVYIDTSKNTLYGPKSTSGWGFPESAPQNILQGSVVPDNESLGVNGDFYYDTLTSNLYGPKRNNDWGSPVLLTADLIIQPGVPDAMLGNEGNYYIDSSSVPKVIYGPKNSSGWPMPPTDLTVFLDSQAETTGDILKGPGLPGYEDGLPGDYYIDTNTNTIYGPKGETSWPTTGTVLGGSSGSDSGLITYIINEIQDFISNYWIWIVVALIAVMLISGKNL